MKASTRRKVALNYWVYVQVFTNSLWISIAFFGSCLVLGFQLSSKKSAGESRISLIGDYLALVGKLTIQKEDQAHRVNDLPARYGKSCSQTRGNLACS